MANKKKRKPKVSNGIHGGGGRVQLTALQKVLLGGGALTNIAPPAPAKRREG